SSTLNGAPATQSGSSSDPRRATRESSIGRWQLAQLAKRMGAISRVNVAVRTAGFAGAAGSVVREHAAATATSPMTASAGFSTRLRLYKENGRGPEDRARCITLARSEVEREVQADEPRRDDRRRVRERRARRRAVRPERRVVDRSVVRVQQVLQVHADVEPAGAEPDDLREPHVDLAAAAVRV